MEKHQKMYKGRGRENKNLGEKRIALKKERVDKRQDLYYRPGLEDSASSMVSQKTTDILKKKKRILAETNNRPPFITAVPVGRFLPNEKYEVFNFQGDTPIPKKRKSLNKKRKSPHRPPFIVSTRRPSIVSVDRIPRLVSTSSMKKRIVTKKTINKAAISQQLFQKLRADQWIQSSSLAPVETEITFNIAGKSSVMTSTVQKEVPISKASATVTSDDNDTNKTFDFFDGISPLEDHTPVKTEDPPGLNATFTEEDVVAGDNEQEEPVEVVPDKIKYPDSIARHKARASKLHRSMAIKEEFSVDLEQVPEGRRVKFSINAPVEAAPAKRSLFEEAPPVNKVIEKLKRRSTKRGSRSIDDFSSMEVTPPAKSVEMLKKRASKRSSRSVDDMSQLAAVTPPVNSPFIVSLLTPSEDEEDTPSKRRRTKQSSDLITKKNKSANYYYTMLDDVTAHLRGMAQIWLDMKAEKGADLPDLANEMIDSATGQTNLLITKKFVQFRKLVGLYDRNAGDKKIYSDDLDGFWSMMYMQVEDLYQKFAELQTMADKGWHEEGTAKQPAAKKRGKKKKTRQPAVTKSSGLLDFIRKTRMEKMQSGSSTETEAPPVEVPMTPSRQSRRLTLNYVTPRRRSDGCSGCTPSSKSAKKRTRRTQVE